MFLSQHKRPEAGYFVVTIHTNFDEQNLELQYPNTRHNFALIIHKYTYFK